MARCLAEYQSKKQNSIGTSNTHSHTIYSLVEPPRNSHEVGLVIIVQLQAENTMQIRL